MIDEFLEKLNSLIDSRLKNSTKKYLSFDEAADYLQLSKNYLYQLTHKRIIPHYKPNGKMVYFARVELDAWIEQNRIKSIGELETEAINYATIKSKSTNN